LTGEEESDVRMASEHVIIDVYPSHIYVRASFVLETGSEEHRSFRIGYPENWPGTRVAESGIREPMMDEEDGSDELNLEYEPEEEVVVEDDFGLFPLERKQEEAARQRRRREAEARRQRLIREGRTLERCEFHPAFVGAFAENFPEEPCTHRTERVVREVSTSEMLKGVTFWWESAEDEGRGQGAKRVCWFEAADEAPRKVVVRQPEQNSDIEGVPIRHFEAYVDGASMSVDRAVFQHRCPGVKPVETSWWLFETDLPANASIEVEARYFQEAHSRRERLHWNVPDYDWDRCVKSPRGQRDGRGVPVDHRLYYELRSGAFWRGNIGHALLEVRVHVPEYDSICCNRPYSRQDEHGNLFFEYEDFEPDFGLQCRVRRAERWGLTLDTASNLEQLAPMPESIRFIDRLHHFYRNYYQLYEGYAAVSAPALLQWEQFVTYLREKVGSEDAEVSEEAAISLAQLHSALRQADTRLMSQFSAEEVAGAEEWLSPGQTNVAPGDEEWVEDYWELVKIARERRMRGLMWLKLNGTRYRKRESHNPAPMIMMSYRLHSGRPVRRQTVWLVGGGVLLVLGLSLVGLLVVGRKQKKRQVKGLGPAAGL